MPRSLSFETSLTTRHPPVLFHCFSCTATGEWIVGVSRRTWREAAQTLLLRPHNVLFLGTLKKKRKKKKRKRKKTLTKHENRSMADVMHECSFFFPQNGFNFEALLILISMSQPRESHGRRGQWKRSNSTFCAGKIRRFPKQADPRQEC